MITLTLVPRKQGNHYEPVEIRDMNGYLWSITPIDTFYVADDKALYEKLYRGESVVVELVDIVDAAKVKEAEGCR